MRIKSIVVGVCSLILGFMLVKGGIQKFSPRKKAHKQKTELTKIEQERITKIRAYIGGMKKTGYFWEFLGISEILVGILLISQFFTLLGAIMAVPITIQIFFFHLFLEPHHVGELITTGVYLVLNIVIILAYAPKLVKTFLSKNPYQYS